MSDLIPCVGAVILDEDGRLCVIQRGKAPAQGRWSLPGGRVEAGESDEEAIVREVLEETGLRVSIDRSLAHLTLPAPDGRTFAIHDYLMRKAGKQVPIAGDDAADARFVTVDELRELPTTDGLLDFLAEHGILEP